jgi:hypothetical protein
LSTPVQLLAVLQNRPEKGFDVMPTHVPKMCVKCPPKAWPNAHTRATESRNAPLRTRTAATREEVQKKPNIPSQEKFHNGVSWGLRNISETP